MSRRYTVSDGKLVLLLEAAEEGGFVVTSPLEPSLVTEAESIAEAFDNARDALRELARARR
jgi:predicted RNase H-like HicB family nuclease